MGAAIWIEIQGRPLGETSDDCGKMERLSDALDDLAVRLGVPKLSGFFDYSEMTWEAEDEAEEEPEVRDATADPVAERATMGEWYDSAQGLATMQALGRHLVEHPDAIELPTRSPEDFERYHRELVEELQLCERFLAEAVPLGRQFRLLIIP